MPERPRVKRWRVVSRGRSRGLALLVAAIAALLTIVAVWPLIIAYDGTAPLTRLSKNLLGRLMILLACVALGQHWGTRNKL
jgi:hypothetical protein